MAFCSNCGNKLNDGEKFCSKCGTPIVNGNQQVVYIQSPQQDIYVHERKSKGLAMTLCFFGGWFGLHWFYLRKYLSGSLYLLFSWTLIPLLLSIIDFIAFFITPKSIFHQRYDK